jgi:hypothetical protein
VDPELLRMMGSRKEKRSYATISSRCTTFLNQLLPGYDEHVACRQRAYALLERMRDCPRGSSAWQLYEEFCVDALTYLLVPPFRGVRAQVTGGKGSIRRDAIIDNDVDTGFWRRIRDDFQARHVVCEFKNIEGEIGGAELHSLRVYLSNPAIGRFGLLFTRGQPSRACLAARRTAYEQARQLIVIVDDRSLEDLLKARAFLGTADDVLERMRHDFEVSL